MATGHPIPTDPRFQNLAGQKFGRWTVLAFAGYGNTRQTLFSCLCDCGKIGIVAAGNLKSKGSKSCGCLLRDMLTTHGGKNFPEYEVWSGMIKRCHTVTAKDFHRWGGRGIVVCDRWRHDFAAFLADMGSRHSPKHSIDRFPDQNGNYEPANCRWATAKQQARNARFNRLLTFNGKTLCLAEWGEITGMGGDRIRQRLNYGWSIDRALTEPVHFKNS